MNSQQLIEQGNSYRAQHEPERALQCYAQAFVQDPDSAAAFNNYGNVMRELGHPQRAVPFLQHATVLDPQNITAQFNLAVSWLLMGRYDLGWSQYETRWQYEHLAGTLPQFSQPRWQGESLQNRTILVVGEQGHGDNIQFVRLLYNLHQQGARIKLQVTDGLVPLLRTSPMIAWCGGYQDDPGEFDTWSPIMSLAGVLGVTLENLNRQPAYLSAQPDTIAAWQQRLGAKTRMRVGVAWSGRTDSWINQHKSVPFEHICMMIKSTPHYEWINMQVDATAQQEQELSNLGVTRYPGTIQSWADTAGLMHHLDVMVGVDTATSHLAAALGRPTWIMLNQYATDWRWLLGRDDSPWYPTARLFRQPRRADWLTVTAQVLRYLSWFKV